MKKLFVYLGLAMAAQSVQAQSYLPLTGGNLTGNLSISSGFQMHAPYYGFNTSFPQPSNSSVVAFYPNPSTNTLDAVGWVNGWRFIPNNSTSYAAPVVTFDASGNSYFAGNMGIGTASPTNPLTVSGSGKITDPNTPYLSIVGGAFWPQLSLGTDLNTNYQLVTGGSKSVAPWNANLVFNYVANATNYPRMVLTSTGNLGIGTMTPQSLLAVAGTITGQQVVVTQTGWADFVFDSAYKRPSLENVAAYAHQFRHLPGVPSITQIEKDGLNLGDMEKLQMQKIEELTLYAVDADKHAKAQDSTIAQQQALLLEMREELLRQGALLEVQQKEIDRLKRG